MPPDILRILTIETSGQKGSIAAALGDRIVMEESLDRSARHAGDLLPAMDRVWHELGWQPGAVDECYVSIGPGSFTGLRLAVTVARHLALAVGTRIVAVPTLDVIAEVARPSVRDGEHLAVMLDAKRSQIFGAIYRRDANGMTALGPASLLDPNPWLARAPRPCTLTGEGVHYHQSAVTTSALAVLDPENRWPSAAALFTLGRRAAIRGEFANPHRLTPLYVRIPEAEELWAKRNPAAD